MVEDNWLSTSVALNRLRVAGYTVDERSDHLAYRKIGVLGKIHIHPQGVDGVAVMRLEDRGS